jgi:hypothetical protein
MSGGKACSVKAVGRSQSTVASIYKINAMIKEMYASLKHNVLTSLVLTVIIREVTVRRRVCVGLMSYGAVVKSCYSCEFV